MTSTYISKVSVDLWKQAITLTWAGPDAHHQPRGPFHCSPGKGITGISCDLTMTSRRANTNCTPKGEWTVLGYQRRFIAYPEAEWVTQFQSLERGIAFHYYPVVPQYPASHGCVRIADYEIARLIYNKTEPLKTKVVVHGELRPIPTVLSRGQTGSAVEKMQRRLAEKGYHLAVDGDFGPATETVLKQFQQDAGLSSVDGVFGPATYDELFASHATVNHRMLVHA